MRKGLATALSVILLLVMALSPQVAPPALGQTGVFINEIHYDNAGTDAGEAIEIAGPAGTDLTGWSIVLYNGSGGAVYNTTSLSGVIADQCGGYGTLVANYPVNGIQNGAPDGIALVDNSNTVIQFLSYEGTFVAADGPASGLTSTDIGVLEDSGTAIGTSLQLGGTGATYEDFTWNAPAPNTFGACNTGQTFSGGGGPLTNVIINEVDADTPGTDAAEFVELYDGGVGNTDLSSLVLVLFNGNGDTSYAAFDLDGYATDANGYILLGNSGVTPTPSIIFSDNGLQNGADAVALYVGDAADFPVGAAVTTANLVDAIVYDTDDVDDTGLLPLLNAGQPQVNEAGGAGGSANDSNQRCPNGSGGARNTDSYIQASPTPGAANNCEVPAGELVINEIDYDQPSTDSAEFIEIRNNGDSDVNLAAYSLELVNGTGGGASVYNTISLPDVNLASGDYFVVCGDAANVADCDLDVSPDTNLVQNGAPDAVALLLNGGIVDSVSYEGDTGAPYTEGSGAGLEDSSEAGLGISRCPDGTDTNQNNVDFSLQSITPGAANSCPLPEVIINEVDSDTPGDDALEFVELYDGGTGSTSLDGLVVVFYNGSSDVSYAAYDLDGFSTDANGYFLLGNGGLTPTPGIVFADNGLQNGADAVALFAGDAANFPNGTSVTTNGLVDAIVYDTDDGDDAGLLVLLNAGQPQVNENGAGDKDNHSNQRCPNGSGGARNTDTYAQFAPTPGAINICTSPLEIWQIQGAAHLAPETGNTVATFDNIVTSVTGNGFWMQTPDSRVDSDVATSNGIFVFTGGAPGVSVGDQVDVVGTIAEFRPGGIDTGNLTITEFDAAGLSVSVDSSGNPLPEATVIGNGGRLPPTEVIDDDATGNVEEQPPATFDAASDGIDFYESLEGMRVQINDAVVVGPTNRFGEIWVLGDSGANATGPFSPRGGLLISPTDFNPERIQLDDDLYPGEWPDLNVGARLTSPAIGVMNYGFGNFEVYVTDLFTVDTSGEATRETTPLVESDNHLTVATFNVENLGGNASDADFAERAGQIVNHLLAPDILVLEEMQDNSGATDDGTVDATDTFNRLIAAIANAGGPTYQFAQIDPVDLADGGIPGGNIRVGFLYNPARVSFTPVPGGDATTANSVTCNSGAAQLDLNPGRVDPNNGAYLESRKPLAGQFEFNGQPVYVVGVHFSSKGGDDPLFGFAQPPVLYSEPPRIGQAQAVNDFVDQILACDSGANILVLGDVNDFQFSTPVDVLKGGVLNNLFDLLPANEQYSYVFEGNSQVLDQIVVSNNLFNNQVPEYDVVHVNAEFTDQVSDHDPSVSRFWFNQPPDCSAAAPSSDILWPPNHEFVPVEVLGVTDPDGDEFSITIEGIFQDEAVDADDSGNTSPDGQGVGTGTAEVRAERVGTANGRVYHIGFTATDSLGGTCSSQVLVGVPIGIKDTPVDDGALYDSTVAAPLSVQ